MSSFVLPKRPPPLWKGASIYFRIFRPPNDPLYFGKTASNRWDDPLQNFGVCYVGESFDAAAVETLLHSERSQIVLASQIETRSLAFFFPSRSLRLVDLTEARTLRALQIDDGFCKGPSENCQQLSKALYDSSWDIDGIRYASRLAPKLCAVALYDRCQDAIEVFNAGMLTERKFTAILANWVKSMGVKIVPG